ncbi:uncharacterized protein TEOVI_000668900 [Trypanosoma equiperdum]|uniref:Expression site-associated gene 9 (ESAG9) protein n=1 Tax=Trypanosoma equiperdum TaxID=5694 RepID=A0A1G4I7F9_TRYEQ|nr:hypothetical protein TEOVI_000668900 [Trypanosoma equiperdum]
MLKNKTVLLLILEAFVSSVVFPVNAGVQVVFEKQPLEREFGYRPQAQQLPRGSLATNAGGGSKGGPLTGMKLDVKAVKGKGTGGKVKPESVILENRNKSVAEVLQPGREYTPAPLNSRQHANRDAKESEATKKGGGNGDDKKGRKEGALGTQGTQHDEKHVAQPRPHGVVLEPKPRSTQGVEGEDEHPVRKETEISRWQETQRDEKHESRPQPQSVVSVTAEVNALGMKARQVGEQRSEEGSSQREESATYKVHTVILSTVLNFLFS